LNRPSENAASAVVVGGGATGCGVARDLALRGFRVTLVEFDDLGSGTSSRFHGMLQSGARYAVSDTIYAAECMRERRIVAALVPDAVEPVGGLFVALAEDPADFPDRFRQGCEAASIPVEELDPAAVMAAEPSLSRKIRRAFSVPDATINPWQLVNRLAADLRLRGGEVLLRHRATAIAVAGGRVRAVAVAGPQGARELPADVVVNAAGAWSGRIAALAGGQIDLQLTKGSILVMAHRMVGRVVNRCRPPSSHDIMAPTGTVALFGTTSEVVDDPDCTFVRPAEIQELLAGAEPLVPGIGNYRALRAWAGVRPLVRPPSWPADQPLPRRHKVIDHGEQGIAGFFTVCGGSLTTHRSMAEDLGNQLCRQLGIDASCRSATTPLLPERDAANWRPAAAHAAVEAAGAAQAPICECEAVQRQPIAALIAEQGLSALHDLRRRLRIGFGPCQGTFCANRVAGLIAEIVPDYPAAAELAGFWAERRKGMARTAWGEQARQLLLADLVYAQSLGLGRAPATEPPAERR